MTPNSSKNRPRMNLTFRRRRTGFVTSASSVGVTFIALPSLAQHRFEAHLHKPTSTYATPLRRNINAFEEPGIDLDRQPFDASVGSWSVTPNFLHRRAPALFLGRRHGAKRFPSAFAVKFLGGFG